MLIDWLYISFILHQTATILCLDLLFHSCISPLSYIKPQLRMSTGAPRGVVYLLYPTSNRNILLLLLYRDGLYISFILHQTATALFVCIDNQKLYISFILHQTATKSGCAPYRHRLYISFILHQTATVCHLSEELPQLYISFILHQTATIACSSRMPS